jgi:hypothetical protein
MTPPFLMPRPNASSKALAQMSLVISSWLFVLALHSAHATYLQPIQEMWGFPYFPLKIDAWLLLLISTSAVALTLPRSLARPSSLVMFILYLIVFLPTMTITLAVHSQSVTKFGPSLGALTAGFLLINVLLQKARPRLILAQRGSPSSAQLLFLSVAFLALWAFIVISFKDVMTFATLDNVYGQREAGCGRNALEAYGQTYLAYVFSPALLAVGLVKRRLIWITAGALGFLTMYTITAERTIFLLPLVMVVAYKVMRMRAGHTALMSIVMVSLALLIHVSVQMIDQSPVFELISLYFVFRTFSIPGAMLWQYEEVFSEKTLTLWSNVKGFDWLVQTPLAFESDPKWPQLGRIVAERVLEKESNSNANLFVYDGLAAAGPVGILAICVVLGIWLSLVDRTTSRTGGQFACLVYIPVAFVLANGSIFSTLLSFGGLFWLVYFAASSYYHTTSRHQLHHKS